MTTFAPTVEQRVDALDPTLFDAIYTQMTVNDRRSLLALQSALCRRDGGVAYLEIGSFHGGSLQPSLLDPRCTAVVSIDARPAVFLDGRGVTYQAPPDASGTMRRNLEALPGADLGKLTVIERETGAIDPASLRVCPGLCLVDGEHTDRAVLEDAAFCLQVMGGAGVLAFHDANIIYRGLRRLTEQLDRGALDYAAYLLPDALFVIEVGDPGLFTRPPVWGRLQEGFRGFLWSMEANEGFFRGLARSAG